MARKILLADDSVTAQNMGRKILADAGYEVITVNNGSAALKKITEQKPDLIVLDVYMPGYSGLEVCQRLKEVAETARIPVLLTVGKLEPFKTDEAKRVRADGFIVKPFEASELLSALSKLEDKIVPRGESKPGRFARATAAIDESHDRTVAADEDNGWKSRISFPSKKKAPVQEPDGDDPAIYNAVNKDLRTVVEHQSPAPVPEVVQEEKVDLGALAPEGLPKDVTPEEIAALAAAAAQMQGKVLESKVEERESPAELKSEVQPAAPRSEAAESPSSTATFAEQAVHEKAESAVSASQVSAIASETAAAQHEGFLESEGAAHATTAEPVTMAAAAGAQSGGSASRWTAVSVALAPEESGISLEQEMQKAYAEFAAQAEGVTSASMVAAAEPPVETASLTTSAIAEPEPSALVPNEIAGLASSTADTIPEAARDFDTAAKSEVTESSLESAEAGASLSSDLPVATDLPTSATVETTPEEGTAIKAEGVSKSVSSVESSEVSQMTRAEELPAPEITRSSPAVEHAEPVVQETDPSSGPSLSSEDTASTSAEPVLKAEDQMEPRESDFSDTTAAAWASWRKIRETGGAHSTHAAGPSQEKATDDDAAMAVAAGAENAPEEASETESDPAIASIVDSVLADLRPKIVEEISRKLGKKK